jgi:hypothetical protein
MFFSLFLELFSTEKLKAAYLSWRRAPSKTIIRLETVALYTFTRACNGRYFD